MKKLLKLGLLALCLVLGLTALAACNSNGFDTNRPVIVVTRESGSGTRDAFMELLYGSGFRDIRLPADAITQSSTAGVLTKIKSDPQAIGYDSLGYVTNDVKMLKVNGVECTADNIRNGSYSIARPLSVVYKEERLVGANVNFHQFLLSSNAQAIIAAEGYVNDPTRTEAYTAEPGLTGTIIVTGSTSLEPLMLKLREAFLTLQPNVTINVMGSGSGPGRNDTRDDENHFGMVSSPVTQSQIADMQSKGGTIKVTKVADDGIAIIVHKTNSKENITIDQLKNLYNAEAETKYTKWAEME